MNQSTLNIRAWLYTAMTVVFAGCAALPDNTVPASTPAAAVQTPLPAEPMQSAPQIATPAALPDATASQAVVPLASAVPSTPQSSAGKPGKPAVADAKPLDHKAPGPNAPSPARKSVTAPVAAPEAAPVTLRPPVTAEAPRKEAPVAAARPAPLDIGTLEKRLRETKAIGVMSKLALKNQIDDLLARFRKAHDSGGNVAALRQPYESLLGKVQSLLDDDPKLATELSASREAIWSVLTDPVKFRGLS